jgi:hypothetical protein
VTDLTTGEIGALAAVLGLPVTPEDVAEVTHRLNALIEALAPLADWPLETVEPVPIPGDSSSA